MDTALFLTTFIVILKMCSALVCYKCDASDVTHDRNRYLCRYMNESDHYKTSCPKSTFCYKKVTYMKIRNETLKAIERGCAKQTWSGNQKKVGRSWKNVDPVYDDVYTEGCFDDPSNHERAAKRTHCYCSGDLCNSSYRGEAIGSLVVVASCLVVWLFNS